MINLKQTLEREMIQYAGNTHGGTLRLLHDVAQQCFSVVFVSDDVSKEQPYIALMACILQEKIIIEHDIALDKPLVDALMVNAGIPRSQIVLAYAGETLPETSTGAAD